ncbi:MAG: glutamate synthase large subunit [Alphaproteobacteria bacterium CG_4_10_14_0_2_um_filter_63_37]|nr:MAG: glutamate synthase subunit alpha [Proteobacteria bacterium CG1_02_64_396]PJA25022.1 MAG: glutamate synthase large subunit [Alphaproteobacteria bacterium CG_4_10_14_0_2_um_filter_63_37]
MACLGLPPKSGLYDPSQEKDACGVGFVVDIQGRKSHELVRQGIEILVNLTHRGAVGADPRTGDGAGILLQLPHRFFRRELAAQHIELPEPGHYGVGQVFLPQDETVRARIEAIVAQVIAAEGQRLLAWRDVPVEPNAVGEVARSAMPVVRQVFVAAEGLEGEAFERKMYVIRKSIFRLTGEAFDGIPKGFHFSSMSANTIVYKGMLLAEQVDRFYPDLCDPAIESALALVHQRFSTNTFPTWDLAQPFRMIAHNGEINTVRGNKNWMNAREATLASPLFGDDLPKTFPIMREEASDSATFDNALEFLVMNGRSLPQAAMLMVPEAWESHTSMDPDQRSFYEFHAAVMEPWDGPAAIIFSDGTRVGGTLDRNGLRPARYIVTSDDRVILASEVGVLDVPPAQIKASGRLQPGKMLLIDTEQKRIIADEEVKRGIVERHPYRQWVQQTRIGLDDLGSAQRPEVLDDAALHLQQKVFGYSREDERIVLLPMATSGQEAIGSMGNDASLAVLSDQPQLLYGYFKQLFAQVTNPPIDPIREELVMSLTSILGLRPNLLSEDCDQVKRLWLKQPILTCEDLERIRAFAGHGFKAVTLKAIYPVAGGGAALTEALDRLCRLARKAIDVDGATVVILSDRGVDRDHAPIPALLAISAVHHDLVEGGLRTRAGLVVETGEARETGHFALLVGFGAEAINPWVALESLEGMARDGILPTEVSIADARARFVKAAGKGMLKIFSKMGISTLQSYCGAQIFEAIGINRSVIDRYFAGTASRVGGIDIEQIAQETAQRHGRAFAPTPGEPSDLLASGGQYAFRANGEFHQWNPETIHLLQHATRSGSYKTYKAYSAKVDDQSRKMATLRGLFELDLLPEAIPLDEVESAEIIAKRFCTGAMSFGSIGKEAHETLAIAMNRIGGRSNTGEGGEDPARFTPYPNGDSARSAIKQVASGRFGVTTHYLVNADELQIKVAQGAKPGEGGQLPGHKVDEIIARVRHSTPGVSLISPPPHHDIYSIEDLAQLIFDLKNVNPQAVISVKLVAEVGVGTVAAGVAKAHSDLIVIAGHDGGTGASPLTSIKHAGIPWEIGLAETQQTLVLNDLRSRVVVQTDGQLKTGYDVVVAALLGAEEYGFATSALIVEGCIMMRKCHLNTCPVGIATQDPRLRSRYNGSPDHVVNFFMFIAQEVREWMAHLGFRSMDEMIGRVDKLGMKKAVSHWKAKGVDLSAILAHPATFEGDKIRCTQKQDHGLEASLDNELIVEAEPALTGQIPVAIDMPIKNVHRSVGTMLAGEVTRRFGQRGLKEDTILVNLTGIGGQSFGAFNVDGVTLNLRGQANDYVGKGMSGGRIVVSPSPEAGYDPTTQIVVGNTLLYGATGGEAYFHGMAGERFAVRNSGALAVVEGTGDHGCEYMTGGVVVVLGPTGRNFAAGMSGGVAFVLNETGDFADRCNLAMVDLEPISDEADLLEEVDHQGGDLETHGLVEIDPLNDADARLLHQLVWRHHKYTGSRKAKAILERWQEWLPRFVKVMPIEYRRVLEQRQREEARRVAGEVQHG